MDPWHIIGWIVLGWIAIVFAFVALRFIGPQLLNMIWCWRMYRKTRDISPQPGDTWVQERASLHIEGIADNGRIVIRSGAASWSDSPSEWKNRVRNRRLYLERRRGAA